MGIFGKLAAGKLPVPQQEMYAEYIKGEAYSQAWECCGKDAPVLKAFETALIRILFSNFRYDGLTPAESNMIERNLIMSGRICAVRSNLSVADQTEDGIFFGRISQNENTLYDFYGYPKRQKLRQGATTLCWDSIQRHWSALRQSFPLSGD